VEIAMNPWISAIIPTYNNAAFLAGAVESVRIQNCSTLEIIVVDDGSTDNSHEILELISGQDLRVLVQDNQGAASARNRGIEVARGQWIAFLDSDDLWLPDKLAVQVQAIEQAAGCGFSFGDSLARDISGASSIRKPHIIDNDIFRSLLVGPQFSTDSVMVRRDCFDRCGYFDPRLRTGEDWDMWLRLASVETGVYVPEALCVYHPPVPGKYPIPLLHKCTELILDKIYSNVEMLRLYPRLIDRRRWSYAWHYSVLAKSYLRQAKIIPFLQLAMRAVITHPVGLYYLGYRWWGKHSSPDLIGAG
jgi:glycosyltransferase involved in cell wall biosynthesis